MRSTARILLLVSAVMASTAAPALADAFVVLPPSDLSFGPETDGFRFRGSGFSFESDDMFSIISIPGTAGGGCLGSSIGGSVFNCRAGDVIDQSFRTGGEVDLGPGSATIGGTTYSDVMFRGNLDFTATPALMPASSALTLVMDAPFQFTGFLRGFSNGQEVFAVDLTGSGMTSRAFYRTPAGEYNYQLESRTWYEFAAAPAATPEPGTVLLIGSGLAGLLAQRRRNRRTSAA